MANQLTTNGAIARAGGAVMVTSGGSIAYAVVPADSPAANIYIFEIDGTTVTQKYYGNVGAALSKFGVSAAIDSSDKLHIVMSTGYDQSQSIYYAVWNTATDSWSNSGETVALYTDAIPTHKDIAISLDSSDKPHVLYLDDITTMGTTTTQVMYTEKTGASWSSAVQLSARASKEDTYGSPQISHMSSDNISALYTWTDDGKFVYNVHSGGSWSGEFTYSVTPGWTAAVVGVGVSENRYYYSSAGTIYENASSTGYSNVGGGLSRRTDATRVGGINYVFRIDSNWDVGLLSDDGGGWTNEGTLQTGTYQKVLCDFSYNNNNQSAALHYIFESSTTVYHDTYSLGGATTYSGSWTANAIVKKTAASSWSADAIVQKTGAGSFTADATISILGTGSWTADAIVLGTPAGSYTADAIVQKTAAGSWSADAIVQATTASSWSADAWIIVAQTVADSFTADAIVQVTAAGSWSADAILLVTAEGSWTADAIVLGTVAGSWAADAILQKTAAGSYTADAILLGTVATGWTADAVLLGTVEASWTADAWITTAQTVEASWTADAILLATGSGSWTADAIVLGSPADSWTADAIVLATGSDSWTADAILLRVQPGSWAADAIVLATMVDAFTADAYIEQVGTVAGSFTADAIIQGAAAGTFTADAIVQRTGAGSWAADAIVLGQASGSWTADAIVRQVQAGNWAADAIIAGVVAGSFTASAIVLVTGSGSLTADAVIVLPMQRFVNLTAARRDLELVARKRAGGAVLLTATWRDLELTARRRDFDLTATK